jgi:quinolinate synthase
MKTITTENSPEIKSSDFLQYTPEVATSTAAIYERVRHIIPEIEWSVHAPYIAEINRLKRERNAIILAHNYQTPEIFHGVSDLTGDSLALARDAAEIDTDVIVMCGVHFMAETTKLMNPSKTVLIPDPEAGCSLATSITAADVRRLRNKYPDVPVVTYVNTSAEVKAESDVCCTSANAVEVVESLGSDRVVFLPDEFLGRYVASQSKVGDRQPERVLLLTECSMSDNVAVEFPEIEFVRPCNLCPHMKLITLPKILESLQSMQHVVDVDVEIAERARLSVKRMLQPVHQPVC